MSWLGQERRQFVRVDFPCKIFIQSPQKETLVSHTENISSGGVKVLLEERLEEFSSVKLKIYIGKTPVVCQARVIWVKGRSNPLHHQSLMFDTGLEFFDIAAQDSFMINDIVEALIAGKKWF